MAHRVMLVMTESRRTSDIATWIGAAIGCDVTTVHSARNALSLLETRAWQGVIAEARLRDGGGEVLLRNARSLCPDTRTMLLATDRSQGDTADGVVPAWATRAELMEVALTTFGDATYAPQGAGTISWGNANSLAEPARW